MTARPPATGGGAADDDAESTAWAVNPLAPRLSGGGGSSGGGSSGTAGAHTHGAKPPSTVVGLDSYRRNPLHAAAHAPAKR